MSNDVLAVILSALGLLITLGSGAAAGLAWVVRRIDASETRLGGRIDAVEARLADRIDGAQGEITEVKIAIARLEGRSQPPRMLTR